MNRFLILIALLLVGCSREFDGPDGLKYERVKVQLNLQVEEPDDSHDGEIDEPGKHTKASRKLASADCSVAHVRLEQGRWGADDAPARSVGDSLSTRATAAVDDFAINDVWVIQYDLSGRLIGKPIYRDGLKSNQDINLMLLKSGDVENCLWLIANTGDNSLFTEDNVITLTRLRQLMQTYTDEASVTDGGLLMSGSWQGVLEDGATLPTVQMVRAVAKLTFRYITDRFEGGAFKVLNVQLKNVPRGVSYLPQSDASLTAYPVGSSGSHVDYAPDLAPNESEGSYTWFLPENVRGTNPSITREEQKTAANAPAGQADYATFIELRGQVTWEGGSRQNVLYTFFVGPQYNDYSLRRNTYLGISASIVGASDDDDERVQKDVASPFLSSEITLSNIQGHLAKAEATITSDGGSPVTEAGFFVSTTEGFEHDAPDVIRIAAFNTASTNSASTNSTDALSEPTARADALDGEQRPFSTLLTGLTPRKTYYVRPYALNANGMTIGVEASFTTTNQSSVITGDATDIENRAAKCHYEVIRNDSDPNYAVSETGVVYSTVPDFDPEGPDAIENVGYGSYVSFQTFHHELDIYTTYYYRAYAKLRGGGTVYGEQKYFKTTDIPSIYQVYIYWTQGTSIGVSFCANFGGSNTAEADQPNWPPEYGIEVGPIGFEPGTGIDVRGVPANPIAGISGFQQKAFTPYTADEWEVRVYAHTKFSGKRYYTRQGDFISDRAARVSNLTLGLNLMIDAKKAYSKSALYCKTIGEPQWPNFPKDPPQPLPDGSRLLKERNVVVLHGPDYQDPAGLEWYSNGKGSPFNLAADGRYEVWNVNLSNGLNSFFISAGLQHSWHLLSGSSLGYFTGIYGISGPVYTWEMLPSSSLPEVSAITSTSAMISVPTISAAAIAGSQIVDKGILVSQAKFLDERFSLTSSEFWYDPWPDNRPDDPTGEDNYMIPKTSLIPNRTYYVRSYVKNSEGHTFITAPVEFTTLVN